ncbi:MAG TPA: glycine zipper 2TM domain-containing protein [Steroidobacteraceae bacterium]|nr:glycine zipper 2TM domain-containing protein [Steroidobacteraceae bacterium]HNS26552.1 glycine zipper 2TM domain-containing protein [Steroidobacteraceae bacterium]
MNRQTMIGAVAGAVLVTGVAALAGYRVMSNDRYAEVLSVEEIQRTERTPREVCRDEVVTQQKPVKDKHQVTGSVVGAVVGGVLGSQIGSGSGRDAATVAGAAAGGYAGNKVQERIQEGNTEQVTVTRCETVFDAKQVPTGEFNVRYRLGDAEHTVKMDHDPGSRLPVKDGKVVTGS